MFDVSTEWRSWRGDISLCRVVKENPRYKRYSIDLRWLNVCACQDEYILLNIELEFSLCYHLCDIDGVHAT